MALVLTQFERTKFADLLVEYQMQHPEHALVHAIRYAREKFPEDRRVGATISGWHQLSWLKSEYEAARKRMEKKKEEEKKQKAIKIDHRQNLEAIFKPDEPQRDKRNYTKTQKVRLSEEERRIFAEACVIIRDEKPTLPWDMVLSEANNYLPPYRQFHRKFTTPSQITWLPELMRKISNELRDKRAAAPVEMPVVEREPQPTPSTNLEDSLIDLLANALTSQLGNLMNSPKLQQKLVQQLSGGTISAPSLPPVEQKKKPNVMIVGIKSDVGQEIQRRWGRVYDFRIFDANVTSQQIKDNLNGVDHAILMTKFVSHSTMNAMRGHPGFNFCPGTISGVDNILEKWMKQAATHH